MTVTAFTASCVPSILMSTDSCQELLCAPGGKVVSSRLSHPVEEQTGDAGRAALRSREDAIERSLRMWKGKGG